MFSGLVEEVGAFISRDGERFRFNADRILYDTRSGDYLAINGCGLSVVEVGDDWLEVELTSESLAVTTFDEMIVGDKVNLERSMRASDRIRGSFYQGMVDGKGEVLGVGAEFRIRLPQQYLPLVAPKGAIAVDGVALAVADATEDGFVAALTSHTLARSTLGLRKPGDLVNLEFEPVAKYVSRALLLQALG